MRKPLHNTAFAASLLAAAMVGYAARSFLGSTPLQTVPPGFVQTKSVPPARVSTSAASAAAGGGASSSPRRWRCLAPGGGYFTDSEREALAHPCAQVRPQLVIWQCMDGAGRAQYTEYKPAAPAMTCSQTERDNPPGWVSTLNSPAFRQWIENQEWGVREDSRSPDVGKVTALVERYNEELADASEIRDKYSDWKEVLASKAFIDWMGAQPAEVQALRSDLTIRNVFRLMELFKGSRPQERPASALPSAA